MSIIKMTYYTADRNMSIIKIIYSRQEYVYNKNDLLYSRQEYVYNQRLPGACNRSPGSKLLSITTQLHCGSHLGGIA